MPPAANLEILEELHRYEQEKPMPYVSSFERIWLEQRMAKGRDAVEEAIDILLRVKFGTSAEDLVPEIRRLSDLEQLRAVLRSIESATNVDDVRRNLPQNGN